MYSGRPRTTFQCAMMGTVIGCNNYVFLIRKISVLWWLQGMFRTTKLLQWLQEQAEDHTKNVVAKKVG